MKSPKISVLLPVYNSEKYLKEAVDSILSQTFPDFELLAVNDGSTDNCGKILASYRDLRIKIVNNDKNRGVIFSLNKGLDLCRGEYIARMDADDIAHPRRLEKQIKFMEKHPRVVVLGTQVRLFTKVPGIGITTGFPVTSVEIRPTLLFENVLQHPTIMLRKKLLKGEKYSENYRHIEDYEFWYRIGKNGDFAILNEVLLYYRLHPNQIGQQHGGYQVDKVGQFHRTMIKDLGVAATNKELVLHEDICFGRIKSTEEFMDAVDIWFNKLLSANTSKNTYQQKALEKVLAKKWFAVCIACISLRRKSWDRYWSSNLSRQNILTAKQLRYFWLESNLFPFIRPAVIKFRNSKLAKKLLLG